MPQRPIPKYWREQVKVYLALSEQRKERLTDGAIHDLLKKKAGDLMDSGNAEDRVLAGHVPSPRTISRIRKDEWPHLPEEERARYRYFYWPESMERGDLPWQSGPAALELLHFFRLHNLGRPTIRNCTWFWRISVTAPDLGILERHQSAQMLSSWEVHGNQPAEVFRGTEWYLAYAPWRSEEHLNAYDEIRIKTNNGEISGESLQEAVPALPRMHSSDP